MPFRCSNGISPAVAAECRPEEGLGISPRDDKQAGEAEPRDDQDSQDRDPPGRPHASGGPHLCASQR